MFLLYFRESRFLESRNKNFKNLVYVFLLSVLKLLGGTMDPKRYPMRAVSEATGLTAHVIRVWEKRYSAVVPFRTPTNHRLYSEEDIERLKLLKVAIEAGQKISKIARLSSDDISDLVGEGLSQDQDIDRPLSLQSQVVPLEGNWESNGVSRHHVSQHHLDQCYKATEDLNPTALETALIEASIELSQPRLIETVITPLMEKIGNQWRDGSLRIANQHLASEVIRNFLVGMRSVFNITESAPVIVVATPTGQSHDIGAFTIALVAEAEGWRVTYLGPNLPAEEIAAAAHRNAATAVALSVTYPPDDPKLKHEAQKLYYGLSESVSIIVGGIASEAYDKIWNEIGAKRIIDLNNFRRVLGQLRNGYNF